MATTSKNDFSRRSTRLTVILQGDSAGEFNNVEDTPALGEDFFIPSSSSFSPTLVDIEKDYAARNSGMNKRPLSTTNLPKFTNPNTFRTGSGVWVSKNDKSGLSRDDVRPNCDIINGKNISMMKQKEFMEEDTMGISSQNSYKYFQEKGCYDSTPLSIALHSTQPQGTPRTVEFLNRIREKSRMHKQSVPHDLPPPYSGSSRNTSNVTKRRSPSILELYKYEGGITPQKIVQEKRLGRV